MKTTVNVHNLPQNPNKYIVAKLNSGELWYWGSWETRDQAEQCIRDNNFDNGIVVELTTEKTSDILYSRCV